MDIGLMRRAIGTYGSSLIFFLGCSSTASNDHFTGGLEFFGSGAPKPLVTQDEIKSRDSKSLEIFLESKAYRSSTQAMKWWMHFMRGKVWSSNDPRLACLSYKILAKEKEFPLRQLAQLRVYQTCPNASELIGWSEMDSPMTFAPWLRDLAVEVGLDQSRRKRDWWNQMHLALEKSKRVSLQNEKIDLIQEALSIARIHRDPGYIVDIEQLLYKVAPRLRSDPTPDEYLSMAYDYRRVQEFERARDYYRRAIDSLSDPEKVFQAYKGMRMTYKLEHDKKLYLEWTDRGASFVSKVFQKKPLAYSVLHFEAQTMRARAHWTEGGAKRAKNILKQLTRDLKKYRPLGEVYWLQARIEEEAKNYRGALSWLELAAKSETSDSTMLAQIRWYQAWNHRKLGELKKAQEVLEKLVKMTAQTSDGNGSSRYRFWLAKTSSEIGDKARAQTELEALTKEDPRGYYGLLAYRELATQFAVPLKSGQLDESREIFSSTALSEGERLQLEWLLSLGEKEIAGEYLVHLARNFETRKDISPEDWLQLLKLMAKSENFLNLYRWLARVDGGVREKFYTDYPRLIFPQPYKKIVDSASYQFGIYPELIYAIMRQESAFDPKARSFADAFGLLQIIPKVAKESASRVKMEINASTDLYDPETNIVLGSSYLRELWDKYNGQFILAVASYNANEKAIKGWINSRFNGDPLEFIEDIPYSETQTYVKQVLRNLIFYRRINAGEQPIPFPEWCLENIQDFKS